MTTDHTDVLLCSTVRGRARFGRSSWKHGTPREGSSSLSMQTVGCTSRCSTENYISIMLMLVRLINCQVEVFRGIGRAVHNDSTLSVRFYGQLRRAVEKVVCVMRRMTIAVAMIARCRVDAVHVLTKDSPVTGTHLCQYGFCLPWQCLFGCSNGRWTANKQ